jgi:hypothetical protein
MRYIDWILPLNVKNTLKKYFQKEATTVSVIEEKQLNPLLETNKVLNNSVGENKTCYILACGPSINEMDLSILKGKDCISVSNFFVHPLYNVIQPKYHVFAPSHHPITQEQYSSWISDFHEKTKFETKLMLNISDKHTSDLIEQKHTIERYYYELTKEMPEYFESITLDNKLPTIYTVVQIAIYLALSLGYKEIRLLGVDHNWVLNQWESKHFYNEKESKLSANGYKEFGWRDTGDWFVSLGRMWSIYKSIKIYCDNNDVKIINNTDSSMLDVFPIEKIK